MLNNCNYNKIKLLSELSSVCWFVEKHALPDLEGVDQPLTKELYTELSKDLEKYIDKLRLAVSGLSKEDKF